jgi:hypothetical protein
LSHLFHVVKLAHDVNATTLQQRSQGMFRWVLFNCSTVQSHIDARCHNHTGDSNSVLVSDQSQLC